ncbi:MAG: class I SAM-dependent methyltransferase, partial [Actinomycetota bacterium]|nr:class I SAM-dependent methyltransferase [Actinomycetota bacterium]
MAHADYLHSVWERVPVGLEPSDFARRREFVLRRLRAQRGQGAEPLRVLDVGCGEGQFAGELARAGMSVLGVDVTEEPLRRARARHPGLDFRLVPVEGSWPLADASFDAVWAGETIEHVADTVAWLSQLRRLLRSGGALLLSTPAHERLALLGL